jgi:hypothetical protein
VVAVDILLAAVEAQADTGRLRLSQYLAVLL